MTDTKRLDLAHDLVLPTLLFAALGGMTWAVRGCSGFGAVAGCIFAGVTWGAAWWFLAHDPDGEAPTRRYSSPWIVLALTVGIGLSGGRGWMQWPSFFEGRLVTDYGKNQFEPISRSYGFLWLFIAGVPWAGIGACLLAWCGSIRETRAWHWVIRIACGIGGAALARYLFDTYPEYFLPLYEPLEDRYNDLRANPNLRRLINDSGAAVAHMGYYLGFLLYEIGRREGKNVALILTVGLVNGAGWALCQNWKWAPGVWPGSTSNWWRCWESSGGISIGVAYGLAYFLVNRRMSEPERAAALERRSFAGPHFEWLLIYLGLAGLLSLLFRFQMGGWGNLYFSVVVAFGVLYYFAHRGTSRAKEPGTEPGHGDAEPPGGRPAWTAMLTNVEPGALALTVALIAGLYLIPPRDLRQSGLYYLGGWTAAGIAWLLIRRSTFEEERLRNTSLGGDPNLQRFGLYLGLLTGLGLSIRNGLKGWFNIYKGNEDYWSRVLWQDLGPVYLAALVAIAAWLFFRPASRDARGRVFSHAYALTWLVLIVQNAIAQLITGPLDQWNEVAFSIYYVLLFFITAVIVFHYHHAKEHDGGVK